MPFEEVFSNVFLMFLCYVYVLIVIVVSSKMDKTFRVSRKASRKFLHIMIGNLLFIVPFFTLTFFPALVAAPFVVVTFLASPYSPFKNLGKRMKGLADITEEGHQLGLVFYAISYTCLALLFASKPYSIAVGILPMAYADAAASIAGERFGGRRYRLVPQKSLEGSIAMFLVSLASMAAGLVFFSMFYSFSLFKMMIAVVAAAAVAAFVKVFRP